MDRMMQGRRLQDQFETRKGELAFPPQPLPGDYWKATYQDGDVHWWVLLPGGSRMCELTNHQGVTVHEVTENPDGTISVSPDIQSYETGGYSGSLINGVWS